MRALAVLCLLTGCSTRNPGLMLVDTFDLAATDASIGTEGAATIDANVKDEANISSSGPATIRLTGRPTCTLRTGSSAPGNPSRPRSR